MPELPGPEPSPVAWRPPWYSVWAEVGSRFRRSATVAGTVAATVVLGAVALVAWRGSPPAPEMTLPRVGSPADPGTGRDREADAKAPAPGADQPGALVHAAGAVARPGLYRVGPDARVADLLEAAGGPTAEADLDRVNLAARVADGDRLYVARKGEDPPAPAYGATAGADPAGSPQGGRPVDLNTATIEQLDELPGVGPATARAIVEHRGRNGRFRSVEDLLDVPGIGQAKLARLRPLVRV